MLSLRPRRTTYSNRTILVFGSVAAAMTLGPAAQSGEMVQIADRCAVYGAGFVDLGNGACGQITGRSRIGSEPSAGWSAGGAANAGLRSDGYGMLPGAGNARHLRIQVDPDFR